MLYKLFSRHRVPVFLIDCLFIVSAFLLAFMLRFDFMPAPIYLGLFKKTVLLVLALKASILLFSGMYRSLWQYASLEDALKIFKTITVASVIVGLGLRFNQQLDHFPRSILLLDWVLLLSLVMASRLAWRAYRESVLTPYFMGRKKEARRTLVVGAGQAGSMLLKELRLQNAADYDVIGIVDDDPKKQGMHLNGVPVLGQTVRLRDLVVKHRVEKVIIAIPSAPQKVISDLVRSCEKMKVQFKTLPGIADILRGTVTVSQIRDVEIEDLLGREPAELDETALRSYLTDKRVLVTGAAGSIGSELCRQVALYQPRKLIILDSAETPLFYLERELMAKCPDLRIIPVVADVRNSGRLETIFEEFSPQVVFHAAAYKHVPMMEYNPLEAIDNNIQGTRVVADLANRFRVENFVMVSTDKAVNPTNVMGATKRAAELYVQALAHMSTTKFTTVRFGNVLGSNGSVIPLFKEQIRKGGPVTVTHPDVIRYFMTIPEASQLVMQAACIGQSGEIFLLDMGEPVRIVDLAEQLIRLSGYTPYEDMDIVFSGLRPGEKLFEELLIAGEGVLPTKHSKIKVLQSLTTDFAVVVAQMARFSRTVAANDLVGAMAALKTVVTGFTPTYQFKSIPPYAFRRVRKDLYQDELPPVTATAERPPRELFH